jgi:hypothetical protein
MSKEKQYVQKCKIAEKQFDNGGSLLNCAFHIDELKEMANGQGWVNITIAKRKEASPKGATHYAYKNEYEPKGQPSEAPKQADVKVKAGEFDDDIPF